MRVKDKFLSLTESLLQCGAKLGICQRWLSAEPEQHWEDVGGGGVRCPGLAPSAFLSQLPLIPTHQGIRARDQLHRHLEEAIAQKLLEEKSAVEPGDALDGIIHSTRELGHELSVQELKVCGGIPPPLFCTYSRSLHTG